MLLSDRGLRPGSCLAIAIRGLAAYKPGAYKKSLQEHRQLYFENNIPLKHNFTRFLSKKHWHRKEYWVLFEILQESKGWVFYLTSFIFEALIRPVIHGA